MGKNAVRDAGGRLAHNLTLPKRAWIVQAAFLSVAVLALFVALTQAATDHPAYPVICILPGVAILATIV